MWFGAVVVLESSMRVKDMKMGTMGRMVLFYQKLCFDCIVTAGKVWWKKKTTKPTWCSNLVYFYLSLWTLQIYLKCHSVYRWLSKSCRLYFYFSNAFCLSRSLWFLISILSFFSSAVLGLCTGLVSSHRTRTKRIDQMPLTGTQLHCSISLYWCNDILNLASHKCINLLCRRT